MPQLIKHIRSSVAGKIPTTTDLPLGVLGLNTYDGAVYMQRNTGTAEIIRIAFADQDYGLITGATDGALDYGALV